MILIDVRKRGELTRDGKIPGSFNIPLIEIEKAFKMNPEDFIQKYKFELPEKEAEIVLSCKYTFKVFFKNS